MTDSTSERPVTTVPPVPVSDLAKRYVPTSGWMPLFEIVADRAARLWAQFELTPEVQGLRLALNDLKRATTSPTALKEKWEANYRKRLEIAIRDFRGMVREAFMARKANADLRAEAATQHEAIKAQAKLDLEQLEERKGEAQAKLDLELIGIGGVKEYQCHTPKKHSGAWTALFLAIDAVFIGLTLLAELAIGQGAIATGTNRLVGQVLVGALAIFTFILIQVTMKDLRGYFASRGARRRFNKAEKLGQLPEGARLFPYPSAKIVIALSGLVILLSSSIGLLAYRILVALKTEGGVASDAAGDIVAPFGLVVIILVTAIYVYSRAHDHTDAQYAEVDRLREVVNVATQAVEEKRLEVMELEQPREFSPADTFQDQVAAAKQFYHDQMDEEEQGIRNEVAQLEAQRGGLFGAMATYQGMYPLYAAATVEAMNHLMEAVDAADDETPNPPSEDERRRARALFGETAKRSLDGNDEFVQSMIPVSFSPSFPSNERLADFDAVVVEVEAEMNAPEEVELAPEPAPVPVAPAPPRRPNVGTV